VDWRDGTWSAEIRIPNDTETAPISHTDPSYWRVNIALYDQAGDTPVAVWGAPELADVQHGALVFLPPPGRNGPDGAE